MSNNLLIIGLDGSTWTLLDEWLEELPHLKEFTQKGVKSVLRTTIPARTSPAVPSLYTGLNPGKHGVFGFRGQEGELIINRESVQGETVWDCLSSNQSSSIISNVPVTWPPKPINGILTSGTLTPDEDSKFITPTHLSNEYENPFLAEEQIPTMDADSIIGLVHEQFTFFRDIKKEEDADVELFWLSLTDRMQHYHWQDKEKMLSVYKAIDKELGEIWDSGEYDDIIIVSDHGFDAAPTMDFNLNTWLAKNGYMTMKGGKAGATLTNYLYKFLSTYVPTTITQKAKSILSDGDFYDDRNQDTLPGVKWDETVAFRDKPFGIRINKDAVEDYESTRDAIIADLKGLEHDGRKVVKEAHKREDIYSGPHITKLPDILIVLHPDYYSKGYIEKDVFKEAEMGERDGFHGYSRDGIFIGYGENFANIELEQPLDIYDVMPTALHMLDVPIPEEVDGEIRPELFSSDSPLRDKRPTYEETGSVDDIDF